MRTKKAVINSSVNIIAFIVAFIPNLIIRKIFLNVLGSELLGLNSLYNNIIGWLSIVELGIGTAIIYSLYKPYAEGDRNQIRAYIGFYASFYRKVGIIILVIGLLISPYLKFFIEDEIDLKVATIGFILSLLNSFISYMFSHKLCILNVAQESYKITVSTTISKLTITFLQIAMLKIYPNFTIFIFIQILVNSIYYILINMYINKKYSWINEKKNVLEKKVKNELIKNVRAMFMHKIGSLIVFSTDNIIISKFVGLSILASYSNYQMIISALQNVIITGLNGITASVGNMLTTGDKDKAYKIHKNVFFLNFWCVSFVIITLYNTLNQFIVIWIGKNFLLDKLTFIVVLINTYFTLMRGSVDQFQSGSGNFYQDRYAPIFEAIINLIISLILVKKIGILGVFLGTLISNFSIIFWTKPYVVYKYVFDKKLFEYFKMYFKYLLISIIPLVITSFITYHIKNNFTVGYFIINCLINIIVINSTYLIIFFNSVEFKYYKDIFKKLILNKKFNNENL